MESSIAEFLKRKSACELLPTPTIPALDFQKKQHQLALHILKVHSEDIACMSCLLIILNVTPKGVLRLAKCHASATREGLRASSREHLPKQKLM